MSHVVDDLDGAVAWYERVFAPRVWQRSELFGTSLALLAVGDVVFMPMEPAPGSGPGRFRSRFGERLHSLALYVEGPVELIGRLEGAGLRLTGHRGQPLEDPLDEIWTQPRETPMVFEFFEPRPSMADPRLEEPDWSTRYWSDEHPLGLQGAHYTLVTAEEAGAVGFLVDVLGGTVVRRSLVEAYGTRSTFVSLSDAVVVEVAVPEVGDCAAAEDLAAGGAFHAVTFRVTDLDRALAHLEANGIRTHRPAPGHIALDPGDTLGVQLRFTDRAVATW
ncbi:MAG TPA: VOC family protein [Acidimicrobiales bacterium]